VRDPDSLDDFTSRVRAGHGTVVVAGLGYVGLPMAVCCAGVFDHVVGVDVDPQRVDAVNRAASYIDDVSADDLEPVVQSGRLAASSDYAAVRDSDVVLICVPTPLRKTGDPDLSYILQSVDAIEAHMAPSKLVVLESTTYPGATDELLRQRLERNGMKVGRDFWLAFSPERINPGPSHPQFTIRNVPKVVGGVTPACTRAAAAFYQAIVAEVVQVSSSKVAEMVKLLENTYRSVNVAMVNELALMCHELGIDVWEVVDAARTKPYGFEAFQPGPGLGGHCIPVDPFYLAWKARLHGFEPRFIDLAGRVNAAMPRYVSERVGDLLNDAALPVRGARILLVGVAYKRDVSDVRESPALLVMEILRRKGALVSYCDPHVPSLVLDNGDQLHSVPVDSIGPASCDCAVVLTDHTSFPWNLLAEKAPLVFDARNALKDYRLPHIHRM
jgi:UDP-N-acetyl-D-glucosamine dehydrogenase